MHTRREQPLRRVRGGDPEPAGRRHPGADHPGAARRRAVRQRAGRAGRQVRAGRLPAPGQAADGPGGGLPPGRHPDVLPAGQRARPQAGRRRGLPGRARPGGGAGAPPRPRRRGRGMTGTAAPPAPARPGRGRPPSLLATGARLPEVHWAAAALALFLAGWAAQLLAAPAWLSWGLYLACYAAGGWAPALSGLRAARERTLDVDLLMIVAATAAACIGQVFDGALLIVIFATSGALEAVVTRRTADSVGSLLDLAPERAVRFAVAPGGEREETVHPAGLRVGDTVLVRPGERIAADGTVLDGESEVDRQAITGESVPVPRREGDEVLSGTVNGTGALRVRVDRPAADSAVARIVALVEQASATKARTQLFIEAIERRYSAGVVAATVLVLGVPLLLGEDFRAALLRAIVFMIVASPCAVV